MGTRICHKHVTCNNTHRHHNTVCHIRCTCFFEPTYSTCFHFLFACVYLRSCRREGDCRGPQGKLFFGSGVFVVPSFVVTHFHRSFSTPSVFSAFPIYSSFSDVFTYYVRRKNAHAHPNQIAVAFGVENILYFASTKWCVRCLRSCACMLLSLPGCCYCWYDGRCSLMMVRLGSFLGSI